MDRYQETAETWNNVAEQYQEMFMDMVLYNDSYDFLCKLLKAPPISIFDIGCGPGNITRYLLSKRPDFKITGIDIAPHMIKLAKANNPSADFFVMDTRNIKEINQHFDAIVCGFCFPYLSATDVSKLISDCNFLLTANGLFYISFVEGDYKNSGFQVGSNGNRVYFYYHDLNNIELLLKGNGFEMVKLFYVNFKKADQNDEVHTIIIAKKNNSK